MTVEATPFADTFGPKAQRKRVKIGVSSLEDMADHSVKSHDTYLDRLEQSKTTEAGNSGADAEGDWRGREYPMMDISPVLERQSSIRDKASE